jgi:hypothetical protein
MPSMSAPALKLFEVPPDLVRPALELCRGVNSLFDVAFYDVPTLVGDLRDHGVMVTSDGTPGASALDLSALRDPEGSLLVVDAQRAPFVLRFGDVPAFLAWREETEERPTTASITGVGSSALGSAALAWDVSKALQRPVLAIVPGYGVADWLLQAFGGWLGFGLHDALGSKSLIQQSLALNAPDLAWLGRRLSASAPGSRKAPTGAPVFRTGCGSSDVLHDLMQATDISCVVGHSKGALSIGNALRSLPAARVAGLTIVTLGCPIAEELAGARYHQYLGLFDALGQANGWGHPPDAWLFADHSTNTALPLSMDAEQLAAG